MPDDAVKTQNALLEPLIGEWLLAMVMPGQQLPEELPDIGARLTFEWMGQKAFVLQRWRVPIPEAPDGLALLGWDQGRGTFLQHYFDERGVARVYEMSFGAGVWKLERTKPTSRRSSSPSASRAPSVTTARGSTAPGKSPKTIRPGGRTST